MLTRRHTLGLITGTALATTIPFVRLAEAAIEKRLVIVILRGALDGLAAVPPYADPHYRSQRGELALADPGSQDGMLNLDGRFGLHPALAPLHPLYREREMLVVHAAATPYRARSHFDAQDLLENGTERPRGAADGWLNRALGTLGDSDHRIGLAVGQAVPLTLRGKTPVGSWAPPELPELDPDFLARLAAIYQTDAVLGPAIREGLRTQAMSDEVLHTDKERMDGSKMYGRPRGIPPFSALTEPVGKLLAAAVGARVAVFELGGWDTHANQGLLTGRLAVQLRNLADGLATLKQSLGPAWRQTMVIVVTEFGRTVAINGTGGTDHGTGSAILVLGGAIEGGRVLGKWPGLDPRNLFEGRDLMPTTDTRAIFKAALTDHLALPAATVDKVVFPGRAVAGLREIIRA
jgi:uncharacterized protein (DUF1501 family)